MGGQPGEAEATKPTAGVTSSAVRGTGEGRGLGMIAAASEGKMERSAEGRDKRGQRGRSRRRNWFIRARLAREGVLCGDSERRPGKVKCLLHGWVLKDVEAGRSHCFQGFRGRGGDLGAARAQAEVKRSRSQGKLGNRHSPRGVPRTATRCAKCCRIESRSQQEDAKGYRGGGVAEEGFGPRQGEGGVWRDGRGLGGCERKGDAGGGPGSSVRAQDTVGSSRLVASGPVRLEPGPASGQPAGVSIAISAALWVQHASWI